MQAWWRLFEFPLPKAPISMKLSMCQMLIVNLFALVSCWWSISPSKHGHKEFTASSLHSSQPCECNQHTIISFHFFNQKRVMFLAKHIPRLAWSLPPSSTTPGEHGSVCHTTVPKEAWRETKSCMQLTSWLFGEESVVKGWNRQIWNRPISGNRSTDFPNRWALAILIFKRF